MLRSCVWGRSGEVLQVRALRPLPLSAALFLLICACRCASHENKAFPLLGRALLMRRNGRVGVLSARPMEAGCALSWTPSRRGGLLAAAGAPLKLRLS